MTLQRKRIASRLMTDVIGQNLVVLERTGSTNDVAKDLAQEGAPDGTVVVADEQTAGRGRMDRRWIAPPETSILCSILFRPDLALEEANRVTMLTALAAADAIEEVTALVPSLKWPNDLIVYNPNGWRKLAGLLTESGVDEGRLSFVVVGIGINVNVSESVLPNLAPDATSLQAETGHPQDRIPLLVALLEGVERRYEALWRGVNPHEEWGARLETLGKRVCVPTAEGTLTGVAEAVDETGALILRTDDGSCHRLLAGDVTLRQV